MSRHRKARKSGTRRRWLCRLLWLIAMLMLGSILPVVLLRFVDPPTTAFMLAWQSQARQAGAADVHVDYRTRPLAQIAPQLGLAVVAAEDQTFPQHYGFDVASIEAAIQAGQDGERLRGASTLTQQLAKNLFLWSGRSFVRKGLEAWFTVWIELTWPKQRILEVYLNVVEFGDGIYGAEAAAQRFFGKPAAALSAQEAALLAAVLPNPKMLHANRPSAYVRQRQAWILRQMQQLGGVGYLPINKTDP